MHTYLSEKLKSSILTCIKIIVGYLVEGYQTLWQNTKCKILVIEDTQMFTPHFNPHSTRPWAPHMISKHSTTELHSLPSPRILLENFMIKFWNESKEEVTLSVSLFFSSIETSLLGKMVTWGDEMDNEEQSYNSCNVSTRSQINMWHFGSKWPWTTAPPCLSLYRFPRAPTQHTVLSHMQGQNTYCLGIWVL